MNPQTFSCGFSSGHLAGSGTIVMLAGTASRSEMCLSLVLQFSPKVGFENSLIGVPRGSFRLG